MKNRTIFVIIILISFFNISIFAQTEVAVKPEEKSTERLINRIISSSEFSDLVLKQKEFYLRNIGPLLSEVQKKNRPIQGDPRELVRDEQKWDKMTDDVESICLNQPELREACGKLSSLRLKTFEMMALRPKQ